MLFERQHIANTRLTAIPGLFSSTYVAPWLGWMGMTGQPGHTIWNADGLKLSRVEELPLAFLDRVRRLHPQQLDLGSV